MAQGTPRSYLKFGDMVFVLVKAVLTEYRQASAFSPPGVTRVTKAGRFGFMVNMVPEFLPNCRLPQ